MNKIRGYLYEIVEIFPAPECECGIRVLTVHDRLEDAEKVMAVLESVNYNFTCYGMMMRPVWEQETPKPCDHNGSTTSVSTRGEVTFSCPKCGLKQSGVYGSTGPVCNI